MQNDKTLRDQLINSYLSSRLFYELIFSIPVLGYSILLTYIIHMSKNIKIYKKFNKKTLQYKKRLTIMMVVYYIYQFLTVLHIGHSFDIGDEFIYLFLVFFKIAATALSPFVLKEQARKIFTLPFKNVFLLYWIIMSINCIFGIFTEFYYNLFFHLITFSTFGFGCSCCLVYLFYKYPKEDLYYSNNNEVYYELQYLPLLSRGYSVKNEKKSKNTFINYTFRKNKTINEIKKDSPSSTVVNLCPVHNPNASFDELSQRHPELLPTYPKIEITFKENYKYYQSFNSNNDFSQDFAGKFFFQIVVVIKDKSIKKILKRSIQDFYDLEMALKREFSLYKYPKKLVQKLPRLRLPRNYESVDFFKNYAINFEIFLKGIVSESTYIIDDVLDFLDIQDEHLSYSYNLARKKCINVSKVRDDCLFIKTKSKEGHEEVVLRESFNKFKNDLDKNKQIISSGSNNIINTPKKIDYKVSVLELHKIDDDYELNIRISYDLTFKIIKEKLSNLIKMLNELSNINKTNENIKNLQKHLSEGVNITHLFGNNTFTTSPLYKLQSPPKGTEKKNGILREIDTVLQHVLDNYATYKQNQIIYDFFNGFFDDSLSLSRCISFHDANKNFIIPQKIKNIISGKVDIPNYIFITIDFKPLVFYIVYFYLDTPEGTKEEVIKKYKYKELKEYISLIKMKLKKPYERNKKQTFSTLDKKIEHRKLELITCLNELFETEGFFQIEEWVEVFNFDRKHRAYHNANSYKSPSLSHKPSFTFTIDSSRTSIINLNLNDI